MTRAGKVLASLLVLAIIPQHFVVQFLELMDLEKVLQNFRHIPYSMSSYILYLSIEIFHICINHFLNYQYPK